MGWQVKVGDHAYHLLSMSVDEIDALAREVGLQWTDFYPHPFKPDRPLGNADKLTRHLAKRHAIDLPEIFTPAVLFTYWELVDDELPAYFEDGMPAPKAEGETSTDGSSGLLESSDGPLTSPDDSPSET